MAGTVSDSTQACDDQERHASSSASRMSKRKRVLTEGRRRQNRESQHRHRQRRKDAALARQSNHNEEGLLPPQNDEHNGESPAFVNPSILLNQEEILDEDTNGLLSDLVSMFRDDQDATGDLDLSTVPNLPAMGVHPNLESHQAQVSSNLHNSTLPSPYTNYLQLQRLNFFAALIQNALHIGVPLFLAQTVGGISPWYWETQFNTLLSLSSPLPSPSSSHNPPSPTSAAFSSTISRPVRPQRCFDLSTNVMPDLSPTSLQRTHPHALYIDTIPFPIFRDRVITLLSMTPPAFDEEELRHDIVEAEGLCVWGGSRAGNLVRDRRNWECKPWFWEKWRLLIRGSGLEEHSRWWRSMRGDEDEDGDYWR